MRLFQPLFLVFAGADVKQLARQVQYLREENRILRGKLPDRIALTLRERQRLIKFGRKLGTALKELISVVTYGTFCRWLRSRRPDGPARASRGRPPKPAALRKLILRIARETGFGSARVLGELRKLTRAKVSREFVANLMRKHGLDPAPKRAEKTWAEFIRIHAATLWQCDFFAKKVLTRKGWQDCFALVFLHVATRRVFVTSATANPDTAWTSQQARAFVKHLRDQGAPPRTIITRDRDSKYTAEFDDTLKAAGVRISRLPPRSPNLQAHVERWIQSIEQECLDHFVPLGQKHLNHLIQQYVEHFLEERPHQSLGNKPLKNELDPPEDIPTLKMVGCKKRLGGVLKHFQRKAA